MGVEFSLRNASASDIDDILGIERDAFASSIREPEAVFRRRIEVFPEGFVLFVDSASGRTAGYLCSERWRTADGCEGAFSVGHDILSAHCPDGDALYISSFALLEKYRGCGNGSALFSRAVARIKSRTGVRSLVLLVNERWGGARRIYESYGFVETARIPGAFPGAYGIVMKCE